MNGVIYNPVVIMVPHSVPLRNYAFFPMPRIKHNGISGHLQNCKDAWRFDVNSFCNGVENMVKFTLKRAMKVQKGRRGTDILFL